MTIKRYIAALAAVMLSLFGLLSLSAAEAPEKVKVSGKIVDEAGIPIIGIAVISSDGSSGTITNDAGLFYLSVAVDDVFIGRHFGKSHRSARMKLLRRNTDLASKTEFTTIGKTG